MIRVHKTVKMAGFMELASRIKPQIDQWKAVNVILENGREHKQLMPIVRQVDEYFHDSAEGDLFICSREEMLVLVKPGKNISSASIRAGLTQSITACSSKITAGNLTLPGLRSIEMRMKAIAGKTSAANMIDETFFKERRSRNEARFYIVDKNEAARKSLAGILQQAGRIYEFVDGSMVVDRYLEDLPDIVFTEVELPDMNGLELTRQLVSYDGTSHVVITSEHGLEQTVLEAKKSGAKRFILKPYEKETIFNALGKCNTLLKE